MTKPIITPQLLERGAEVPNINHAPGEKYQMANLDYGMTIGNAVTPKGRHYVCWVGGGDNPKAFFLLSYSDDDGKTWTEPVLVIDPHDDTLGVPRCTIVGTLWVDPRGRLWLFFNQTLDHFDGKNANWAIRCDDPDAEKPVWSAPQYIGFGCTLNKPIVLDNGEWLLPVSLWRRRNIGSGFELCYPELDDQRMAHFFASADEGQTWARRGGVTFPNAEFDEHMPIQLRDGRIFTLGRTLKCLMQTYSSDRGATWTTPQRAHIQSINARFHMRRLASGRLLLIKHGPHIEEAQSTRSFLTAFLSDDDMQTWSPGFVIDERFEISYPDSDQTTDGRIFITYDRNRAKDGEILMACLREEDILAGRLVSQGAFLQRIIRKPGRLIRE